MSEVNPMGKIAGVVAAAFLAAVVLVGQASSVPQAPKAERDKQQTVKLEKHQSALVLPDMEGRLRALREAPRSTLSRSLASSKGAITYWEGRGKWMRAPLKEKCWQVPWQRQCTIARAKYRMNLAIASLAEKRLKYELPNTNDWRTAVSIAQRVYPGTASWMLYISHREGGYGPWVWYGGSHWHGYHIGNDFLGADTVGGWMQFRFSTFAPYWRGMIKDLRARGYILPPIPNYGGPSEYQPWLWPLGQALTAGYMKYYGKEGCHWCL